MCVRQGLGTGMGNRGSCALTQSSSMIREFDYYPQYSIAMAGVVRARTAFHGLRTRAVRSKKTITSCVPLTADMYHLKRGDFAHVAGTDLQAFREMIGPSRVLTGEDDIISFNTDWMRALRGQSSVVLRPRNTNDVSRILAYCNSEKLAVVPQGGNTGLVGGSVPVFDEVIISLSLMNKVVNLDKTAGVLVCEAGCVLEDLDQRLALEDLIMPLDLGAKGSCQIGGNVSTNAGGLRLLRYGSLHGSVLGLEIVLADGQVLDLLSPLRKDNTGYDLKQLFIGAEGTLGVVTQVAIHTPQRSKSVNVAFLACSSFKQVQSVYLAARSMLGEVLSAMEFLDSTCMALVEKNLGLSNPISNAAFYVLVEVSGSQESHDREKLNWFLERVMEDGYVSDGTVATDWSKIHAVWALRERIAEALNAEGAVYKYDLSLPVDKLYDLVEVVRDRCARETLCTVGYGHIGDGNLHLNVVGEEHSSKLLQLIEPFVYDWTAQHCGSISAEHGLGLKKLGYIQHSKSALAVQLMRQFKSLLDPNGILNPYKTIPL